MTTFLAIVSLISASAAEPAAVVFQAEYAEDARVASVAWEAARVCTGWTPRTHPIVTIDRGVLPKTFLGMATTDEAGLASIRLDRDHARPEILVHEIAHAWVSRGPTALVEGRAELLADCMVRERPGLAPLQWDDGRQLVSMPALHTWDSQEDHGPTVDPMQRTDAYLGAARLVRLASLLLPERSLWPEHDKGGEGLDWADLDQMLADAGRAGEGLRAILHADAETQRLALSIRTQTASWTWASSCSGPTRWSSTPMAMDGGTERPFRQGSNRCPSTGPPCAPGGPWVLRVGRSRCPSEAICGALRRLDP